MGKGQYDTGSRYVRMLFNAGTAGGLTDAQLLERLKGQGGEAAELAFATLVERHGPMVLRVCQSVLRDSHAAHDAFQATFLVLMRRASTLWLRESLGPWLHQVAFRVASCDRSAEIRRRRHERRAAELSGPAVREENHDDLGEVLHDEINRLPWGCRAAVVLCYFEGLSPQQAARQLGCPVGTVQSRLARGRERLRMRLTRRGLAPALGALVTGTATDAAVPPAALVQATIRAGLAPSVAGTGASQSAIQLMERALKSMVLFKFRTAAVAIMALAALAACARALLQEAPASRPQPHANPIRSDLGAQDGGGAAQPPTAPEAGPPDRDLNWTDVAPAEKLRVIELIAARLKGNYEKIKTWQGNYAYVLRQYLDDRFVAQLLAGGQELTTGDAPGFIRLNQFYKVQALTRGDAPVTKAEPLMQEFDLVLTFAIDSGSNCIYRDIDTRRMRFLRVGTNQEVKIPNVGAVSHRSIVTPDFYLYFNPKERATSAFLPDHPQAQKKRCVERFPATEARLRERGAPDPRAFFRYDPVNAFWTGLEFYAQALRGELGPEQKGVVEQRLKISQADGPGGRWYRDQIGGFSGAGEPMRWLTTLWSPEAGYHPVSRVATKGRPDGQVEARNECKWKRIDGIYVPSTIHESVYNAPGGGLSREQRTVLQVCTLNRPLGTHQFDEHGLALVDGDLILNHVERVAYIVKGGKPVKLTNFGEGSELRRPAR